MSIPEQYMSNVIFRRNTYGLEVKKAPCVINTGSSFVIREYNF